MQDLALLINKYYSLSDEIDQLIRSDEAENFSQITILDQEISDTFDLILDHPLPKKFDRFTRVNFLLTVAKNQFNSEHLLGIVLEKIRQDAFILSQSADDNYDVAKKPSTPNAIKSVTGWSFR